MTHIKEGDEIGARFLNNHDDAWEWWRRYKARGEGGAEKPGAVNFSKVMAANYVGSQIDVGDVCEFDGNPFSDPDPSERYPDPRNDRWLKAVTPDTTRVGWGIALDPIEGTTGSERAGGEFLVLGACHAKVMIENEDHKFAERRDGFRVLYSTAKKSACKILHKPAAGSSLPEQRLCLVQIMDEAGGSLLAVATLTYDMCGDTANIVNFQMLDGSEVDNPETADNSVFRHRGMTGDKVLLVYSEHHEDWLVIDATKHLVSIDGNLRMSGDCENRCLQVDSVIAALEICSQPQTRTVFCESCEQTSEQTSEEQTSETEPPQTSVICCVTELPTLYLTIDEITVTSSITPGFPQNEESCANLCDGVTISDVPSTHTSGSNPSWSYGTGGGEDPIEEPEFYCYYINVNLTCADDVYALGGTFLKKIGCGFPSVDVCRTAITGFTVVSQSCDPFYFEAIANITIHRFSNGGNVFDGDCSATGTMRVRITE